MLSQGASASDTAESVESEETWLASEVTESDRSTLNALQQTSKELDGLLNDLTLETSRLSKESLAPDDNGYDSDEGAEHGERELRAQLDSIKFITSWSKDFPVHQQGEALTPSTFPSKEYESNSLPIVQEELPVCLPPAQCARTAVGPSLTQTIEGDRASKDDSKPIDMESKDEIEVDSSFSNFVVLVSENDRENESRTSEIMEDGRVNKNVVALYTKNSPRTHFLQLACTLIAIAILIGIGTAIFARNAVEPVSEDNLAGYNIITISSSPAATTSWLDGTGNAVGAVEGPTMAPTTMRLALSTLSPSQLVTPAPTLKPTAAPTPRPTQRPTAVPTLAPTVTSPNQSYNDDAGKKKLGNLEILGDMIQQYRLRGNVVEAKSAPYFEVP